MLRSFIKELLETINWSDPIKSKGIGWTGNMVSHSAYTKLAWIPPRKFLDLVDPSFSIERHQRKSPEWIQQQIEQGEKFSPLLIYFNNYDEWEAFPNLPPLKPGDIRDHEGRHRASIAMQVGEEKVPVIGILHGKGKDEAKKRWATDQPFQYKHPKTGEDINIHGSHEDKDKYPGWDIE